MSAFGGKRTLLSERVMSAFDPKRTLAGLKSRSAAVSYLGVRSMAWPGGNVTGFTQFEYSLAGKWLELLKEIAPHVTRVGVLRDPTRGHGIGQFAVIQAMAPPHAMELTPIDALDPVETQTKGIAEFATLPNSGMIVTVGPQAVRRDAVIAAAAKSRLPTIYPYRYYVGD